MALSVNRDTVKRLSYRTEESLAHYDERNETRDFTQYENDPRGFFRDVLKDEKLYDAQIEVIDHVLKEPLVTVRGCHGAGKDHVAAGLALWYAYCKPTRVKVLMTGPTQHQVDEILFGDELLRAFTKAKLPGELRSHSLRALVKGKDGKFYRRYIFGRVSTETARLTGHHAPHVMVIITEAQDTRVSEIAFTAAKGNATGRHDRILVVGNPTEPTGEFFATHRANSIWKKVHIPASRHPNVALKLEPEDLRYIPGGPDIQWVERVRKEDGEDSRFWRTRVLAEFPESASDALLKSEWISAAVERWKRWKLKQDALLNEQADAAPSFGIDVARFGGDSNVVAYLRGIVLVMFEAWSATDTVETERRIIESLRRHGLEQSESDGRIYVDEGMAGGGAGVLDHIVAAGWGAMGFDGSKAALEYPERYANMRSWGYWMLRTAFESGQIAIPDDHMLIEELSAITYSYDNKNRILMCKKTDIKATLHRSPDRSDALMMGHSLIAGGLSVGGASGNFGF